jgi:hypothetical protein
VLSKRGEVAVGVQEGVTGLYALGGNERVNRLARGKAEGLQRLRILCRLDGNIKATDLDKLKRFKCFSGLIEVTLCAKALQNFRHDQVTDNDSFLLQQRIKSIYLWSGIPSEEIDPHA